MRNKIIKRALKKIAETPEEGKAKMDKGAEEYYQTDKCKNLMKEGCDLYPEYNTNKEHALKVIQHVLMKSEDKFCLGRLFDMIYAGLT